MSRAILILLLTLAMAASVKARPPSTIKISTIFRDKILGNPSVPGTIGALSWLNNRGLITENRKKQKVVDNLLFGKSAHFVLKFLPVPK